MKKKDLTVLIEGLRKISADITEIADLLSGTETQKEKEKQEAPADPVEEEAAPAAEEAPEKVYSKEEVRAILADKSRSGFRAEVKALLTAHGAKQLSDITDPKELAALAAEAEVIGNG